AINPLTNRVYVANHGVSENVSVIDADTDEVIKTIRLGHFPRRIAINPLTNRIYISDGENIISVIDGDAHSVVDKIKVNGNALNIAVNPLTNRIYTTNPNADSISVIDGDTNQLIDSIKMKKPSDIVVNPKFGIAVNQITNLIYVASENSYYHKTLLDFKNLSVFQIVQGKYLAIPAF
ncbi:MAG: YncE family protein, partial [Bacteroidetes bacterium]|nr:YncE family protein [Bacteroidota bacterium]